MPATGSHRILIPQGTIVIITRGVAKGCRGEVLEDAYSATQRVKVRLDDEEMRIEVSEIAAYLMTC